MNGKKINALLKVGVKHALYRNDGKWYHNLTQFPGALFDQDGYVIFLTEDVYKSEANLQIKEDLHVQNGIKTLKGYRLFTQEERKLLILNSLLRIPTLNNSEETIRRLREIDIILRNRNLVEEIKDLYQNSCQICNIKIHIGNGRFYSEVHHIIPLGKPHNGKDTIGNMICVCPNCHILLDYGSIELNPTSFKVLNHIIDPSSYYYYDTKIRNYKGRTQ